MWALTGQQAHWPIVSHQTTGTVIRALVTCMRYNIKISHDCVVPQFLSFSFCDYILSHHKKFPPSTGFSTNSSQYDMAGLVTLGESLELENSTQVGVPPR